MRADVAEQIDFSLVCWVYVFWISVLLPDEAASFTALRIWVEEQLELLPYS